MAEFLLNAFKLTGWQISGLLGIFFILGYLLSKTQEWTQKKYARAVGWRGLLWTAWLGTPFHEFSHYFFAKFFRHKINRFRLFAPNEATGELGQVDHSFNRFSLYQRVGNFFIGASPMIFGATILFLLAYLILPNGQEIFSILGKTHWSFADLADATKNTLTVLFVFENISRWDFWLFMYLSFCIASHLAPSRADRRGMWSGLLYIVLTLLVVNLAALLFKIDATLYIMKIKGYIGIFTGIFLYALMISIIHFILAYVGLGIIKKLFSHPER